MTIHINPETGEHGKCTATKKLCPYQKQGEALGIETHFRTVRDAKIAGEQVKESLYGSFASVDKVNESAISNNNGNSVDALTDEDIAENEKFIGLFEKAFQGQPLFRKELTDQQWQDEYDKIVAQLGNRTSSAVEAKQAYGQMLTDPNTPAFILLQAYKREDYQRGDGEVNWGLFKLLNNTNFPEESRTEVIDKINKAKVKGKDYSLLSLEDLREIEDFNRFEEQVMSGYDNVLMYYEFNPMPEEFGDKETYKARQDMRQNFLFNRNLSPEVLDKLIDNSLKSTHSKPHRVGNAVLNSLTSNWGLSKKNVHDLVVNNNRLSEGGFDNLLHHPNFTKEDHDYLIENLDNNVKRGMLIKYSPHTTEEQLIKFADSQVDDYNLMGEKMIGYRGFIVPMYSPNVTHKVVKHIRGNMHKQIEEEFLKSDKKRWFQEYNNLLTQGYGLSSATLIEKRMLSPQMLSKLAKVDPNLYRNSTADLDNLISSPDLPMEDFKHIVETESLDWLRPMKAAAENKNTSKEKLDILARSNFEAVREAVKENPNASMKTLLHIAEVEQELAEHRAHLRFLSEKTDATTSLK